jgi:hypothetical protein
MTQLASVKKLLAIMDQAPVVVCLCGSTRFYDQYQQVNYDLTMRGSIVLSVGFYPHARAEHGHGEGVGHDSAEKTDLDQLHLRKIDLADEVFVVSDASGYFGSSTAREIAYANETGKPVGYLHRAAFERADTYGLVAELPVHGTCECIYSCSDDPATACGLSGEWHVHPGELCPVHPDAPGDR